MGRATETESEHKPKGHLPAWARVVATMVAAAIIGLIGDAFTAWSQREFRGPTLTGSDTAWITTLQVGGLFVTAALSLLAAWLLVRLVDHRGFRDLGLVTGWKRGLAGALIGLAVALAAAALAALLWRALGMPPGAELGWALQGRSGPGVFLDIALATVPPFVAAVGTAALWCGYLLRSLSARPVIAVVVVTLAPALVALVPGPGRGMYSLQLLSWVQRLPTMLGVWLAVAIFAIALRSVWAAAGVSAGLYLIFLVSPVPVGGMTTGTAVGLSAILGALFAIAAVIAAWAMGRRGWQRTAQVGPFAP